MELRNKKVKKTQTLKKNKKSNVKKKLIIRNEEEEKINLQLEHSLVEADSLNVAEQVSGELKEYSVDRGEEKEASANSSEEEVIIKKAAKPKRRKNHFKKALEFDSNEKCDNTIREQYGYFIKITHNDDVDCSICDATNGHIMSQIYRKCTCKENGCNFK